MSSEKAAKLKEQGNNLFAKKEYKPAVCKYSEAIAVDGSNAVLYCNRAACYLALTAYQKAREDSQKASELDPKYSKAWGRLAAALEGLNLLPQAIEAWNKALESLPSENATPAEVKQQDQYKTALFAATSKLTMDAEQSEVFAGILIPEGDPAGKEVPSVLARKLLPQLTEEEKWDSSAFVITFAADQFLDACRMMKMSRKIWTPAGYGMFGPAGAIMQISNAIIQDSRCFVITDSDWFDMWNLQVEMESRQFNAPHPSLSADGIIAEARRMHAQGGWDLVRPAIGILLRALYIHAFIVGGLQKKHTEAVLAYDKVLAVQRWGREEWKDVPKDDRGAIFETTLMRGVRCLRLDSYMQVALDDRTGRYTIENLRAEAEDILNEIRSSPHKSDPDHPGFHTAFNVYPQGQALAIIGMYYRTKGEASAGAHRTELLKKSAKHYFAAADMYPEDDEFHIWYLQSAVNMMFSSGAPLKETMPVLEHIRRVQPIMMKIWRYSALGMQRRDVETQQYLFFEEKIKKDLAAGRVSLEDRRAP